MALTPESNLFNISIFSLSVQSVCCLLGFDIVMQKKKSEHDIYMVKVNAFISHVMSVER